VTNITTEPPDAEVSLPTGLIRPTIDGELTSYFEWVGSGCVEPVTVAGSMHQVSEREPGVTLVEFGFDLDHLYVRVDGSRPMHALLRPGTHLSLNFLKPAGLRLTIAAQNGSVEVVLAERDPSGQWVRLEADGVQGAVGQIAEVRIPFRTVNLQPRAPIAFIIALNRGGDEVEHHPRHRPIEFEVPSAQFAAVNWTA
jgi:hypothetical protein